MAEPVTARIKDALVRTRATGRWPAVVWLGWREYGQLYRALATQPDDRRVRQYLGVAVELVDRESLLEVGVR